MNWTKSLDYNITWTFNGNTSDYTLVRIDLCQNATSLDCNDNIIVNAQNDGSYPWHVPFDYQEGVNYTFKFTDVNTSLIISYSGMFSIVNPEIIINSPTSLVNWNRTVTYNITWNFTGTVEGDFNFVSIHLLNATGYCVINITSITFNNGSFLWTVPINTSYPSKANHTIFIETINPANEVNKSSNTFYLSNPRFRIINPYAFVDWYKGVEYDIEWNFTGDPDFEEYKFVKILLNDNNTHQEMYNITLNTTNSGHFTWYIPLNLTVPNGTYYITVDPVVFAPHTAANPIFDLNNPYLEIKYPSVGEELTKSFNYTILWNFTGPVQGNFSNVKIELFNNDTQQVVYTISFSTPNNGSYDWIIPLDPSFPVGDNFTILISSQHPDGPLVNHSSSFPIIGPTLIITNPTANNTWTKGLTYNITWNFTGSLLGDFSNVRIELIDNITGQVVYTIMSSGPNNGSLTWLIPLEAPFPQGDNYLINISTTNIVFPLFNNSELLSIQDNPLIITNPLIDSNWIKTLYYNITWDYYGPTGGDYDFVYIQLLNDTDKSTIFNITTLTPNNGSFIWQIPDNLSIPVSSDYSIVISTIQATDPIISYSKRFNISNPLIMVLDPSFNSEWTKSLDYLIEWDYTGIAIGDFSFVNITLWDNNTKQLVYNITTNTPNSGLFNWHIPANLSVPIGSNYIIAINTTKLQNMLDNTSYEFTVKNPVIDITNPSLDTIWTKSLDFTIIWDFNGTAEDDFSLVNISLWNSTGSLIYTITTGTPNSGSYIWHIPANVSIPIGSNYFIVINTTDPLNMLVDISEAFQINNPFITITDPYLSSNWTKSLDYTITWDFNGTAEDDFSLVNISLWNSTGSLIHTITTGTLNSGNFIWHIPANLTVPIGSSYLISINTTKTFNMLTGLSEEFNIVNPIITITTPSLSNNWIKSLDYIIRWDFGGTAEDDFSFVNITLWNNNTKQLVYNISTNIPNSGNYTWHIPANLSIPVNSNYTISINTTKSYNMLTGLSEEFNIVNPIITINTPGLSSNWTRSLEYAISWSFSGTPEDDFSFVNITLWDNDTLIYNITTYVSNSGFFLWHIPANLSVPIGSNYIIAINTTNSLNMLTDLSNEFYIINPEIAITNPILADNWTKSLDYSITWFFAGIAEDDFSSVRIELWDNSTSQMVSVLATNTLNTGVFIWSIPTYLSLPIGDNYIIYIVVSDPSIYDYSDEFSIINPTLVITQPTSASVLIKNNEFIFNWNFSGNDIDDFQYVQISLWDNVTEEQISIITTGTANIGSFTWVVSDNASLLSGKRYYLVISTTVPSNSINDTSDVFSIIDPSEVSGPTITLLSPLNNSIYQSGIMIELEINDVDGLSIVLYNWDNSTNSSLISPFDVPLLIGDGIHILNIYSNDTYGFMSHEQFIFITDDTPPNITLVEFEEYSIHNSNTFIDLNISDNFGISFIIFNWDNGFNRTLTGYNNITTPMVDGDHILTIYANDSANNWVMKTFTFVTDDTPPIIELLSPEDESIHHSGEVIDLNISDVSGINTVLYKWDNDTNATLSSPYDVTLPQGTGLHILYVYSSDIVDNWAFETFMFYTDDVAPLIVLVSPENTTTHPSATVVNLTITEANVVSQVLYNWDNTPNKTLESPYDVMTPGGDGEHILYVYAVDDEGNWANKTYVFITEDEEPQNIFSSPEELPIEPLIAVGLALMVLILISVIIYSRRKK
jgi:hypothetical protein